MSIILVVNILHIALNNNYVSDNNFAAITRHSLFSGINETTLDSIPDGHTDLVIASDCIGTDYTFLMLELGLTIQDIEIKRNESPNDMRDTIFKLFKTWRQTSEKQSTPRILLNTAKFLGINTAEIVQKLKEKLCP